MPSGRRFVEARHAPPPRRCAVGEQLSNTHQMFGGKNRVFDGAAVNPRKVESVLDHPIAFSLLMRPQHGTKDVAESFLAPVGTSIS